MLKYTDKVSAAYLIPLLQVKIELILHLSSQEVKMYLKKSSYSMKKASGMLLLLCSFFNINAQLYIGTGGSLHVKDSILFQTEKKNSPVLFYVEDITTVHNPELISNIKVVVLSSPIQEKSSPASFAKAVRKSKNKKTDKKVLKLIAK
ncbi:hypothetical protein IW15_16210 [Chryseobacterium soli]|uniref:Uncharacterized protein n=2 Tax=Chryseobacterium soli TaxID=445961 RepID=A0A086A3N0_9FLAO|nr:hypothetical protein IW15_16210 [Chryseobacterium soli]